MIGRAAAALVLASALLGALAADAQAQDLPDRDAEFDDGWELVLPEFWGRHRGWREGPLRRPWVGEAGLCNGRREP